MVQCGAGHLELNSSTQFDSIPLKLSDESNNNNRIERRNSRFLTISSLCHELSPTRALKWQSCADYMYTLSAYHVQHVVLRATWYEGTAQLLRQS